MAGPIRIAILANASQANREIGQVEGRLSRFGKRAGAAIAGAAVAVGAGAVALVGSSVKAASDAQQSLGATETVFGKYADTVIKRSNEAASSIGLSANEYRELSNVVGASLKGAGVPIERVTGLTHDLNQRAADLAATFGGTTREAIEAVSSLLRGEADPIERYGVSIKQADVNARLAAQGLSGLTGEGLKQAEMQARLELLFEKTSDAQGQFARESGTLAGQQQRLTATWENLKVKIGEGLLPVLTVLAAWAVGLLGTFEKYLPVVKEVAGEFASRLAPSVAAIGGFLRDLGGAIVRNALPPLQTLADTIRGDILPALTRLGNYLSQKLGPVFRGFADVITRQLLPGISAVADYIYGTVYPAIVAFAAVVAERLGPVFEALVEVWQNDVMPRLQELMDLWRELWPVIQPIVTVLALLIGSFILMQLTIAAKVLPILIKVAAFLSGAMFAAMSKAVEGILWVVDKLVAFWGALGTAKTKLADFAAAVRQKVDDVKRFFSEMPGKIAAAIGNAGRILLQKGRDTVSGMKNGAVEKWNDLRSWIAGRPAAMRDAIPDALSLLKNIGRNIINGLKNGMISAWNSVRNWISDRANEISSFFTNALRIRSPSRVMMEIGRYTIEGLVVGMRREESNVVRASRALAAAAVLDVPEQTYSVTRTGDDWASAYTTRRDHKQTLEIRLTAQEVDQLARGRAIAADLTAYSRAGGRVALA